MMRTAILVMGLVLSGCASLPQLDPPPALRDPAGLAGAAVLAAYEGDFPTDRWWLMLGDPVLDQLVGEGLAASPDMAGAAARARRAAAFQDQAQAALLPTLAAEASGAGVRISQNQGFPPGLIPGSLLSRGRIAALAEFDLDLWGRKRSALAAATSAAQAAQADMAQARLLLISAIVAAYIDLDQLFARRSLAEAALDIARQEQALVASRAAQGLENNAATSRAESQASRAELELAAIDEAIALSRNALAALAGAGPDRGLVIVRPTLAEPRSLALPANLPVDLVGRRPDLVAARLRAESAAAGIGVARANFYPDINLAALVGLEAIGIDNLFSGSSLIANVGPALRLPLFDGGAARAGYRSARAEYDEAVSQYNAVLIDAVRQVADAVASKRSLVDQIGAARRAADGAQASLSVASERYAAGLVDRRSVLAAERELIVARAALVALNSRNHQADAALAVALGGGFMADSASTSEPER
ncbi:efflux transporter outer membrane subunit [Altererythrobacter lauratis]|uniref:Efflux transporter outer membrane subunit n=1 Tax=Alteraurantiacibacter lauratis TaxID=2054627 RepID=A0ABV7EGC1_9SPHN